MSINQTEIVNFICTNYHVIHVINK